MTAPSFRYGKWRSSITFLSPVAVTKISPILAACSIVITSNPSITASSARSGSTSVTMTRAPRPRRAIRDAARAPAVPADDEHPAREQQIRRADDAVNRGLPGAVAIVEEMFGQSRRSPRSPDISSAPSFAIARRRMTPVVVSSVPPITLGQQIGALFVQRRKQVGAVVHRDVRLEFERRAQVPIVRSRCPRP